VYDLHARVPEPLLEAARRQEPDLSLGALVRLALGRLAGWPEPAIRSLPRMGGAE